MSSEVVFPVVSEKARLRRTPGRHGYARFWSLLSTPAWGRGLVMGMTSPRTWTASPSAPQGIAALPRSQRPRGSRARQHRVMARRGWTRAQVLPANRRGSGRIGRGGCGLARVRDRARRAAAGGSDRTSCGRARRPRRPRRPRGRAGGRGASEGMTDHVAHARPVCRRAHLPLTARGLAARRVEEVAREGGEAPRGQRRLSAL